MFTENSYTKRGLIIAAVTALFFGCSKAETSELKATMSGSATILNGDTAEVRIDFSGEGPYAFRYTDGTTEYNVVDVLESPYILKVTPTKDVEYTLLKVATSGRKFGTAEGSAQITVRPVNYIVDQTIGAISSAWVHYNNSFLQGPQMELSNNGQYSRNLYFEFDAKSITTVEQANRYRFCCWVPRTHSNAQDKSAVFVVSGLLGSIDNTWTWATKPGDADLTTLFNTQTITVTDINQEFKIEGDITNIVKAALADGDGKFVLSLTENTANKSLYYVASTTYATENRRPTMDVRVRREADAPQE